MSENRDIAIQITGLKKRYRLGVIGGGTLQGDIQSWWARKRGKEDPNTKIGEKTHGKNETFMALDGIDLTVYKGERLGIIGHNGAGKSTLLKLLSRVTAPTEGKICIDGRISSMLEVGTGFNPELTGRENIYLNGAILGMSKSEVDEKIDQIIEFSECAQFIDTPVKRYSSGMYVKLAFAVAAHLDSEILVMDEVLAVGDMKFQQKCLGKMSDVSQSEGRTVLYVSHNMNTIRQLCERCIVLDHGKVIYDGDVEPAIAIYLEKNELQKKTFIDLSNAKRYLMVQGERDVSFKSIELIGKDTADFDKNDKMLARIIWNSKKHIPKTSLRMVFLDAFDKKIASSVCFEFDDTQVGINSHVFSVDLHSFVPGTYFVNLVLFSTNEFGTSGEYDVIMRGFVFEMHYKMELEWNNSQWGTVRLQDMQLVE